MNNTRTKLRETKAFLNRMKKTSSKPQEFVLNLQSFLSSARSVTSAIKKEFGRSPDFHEWFKRTQREMQSDELLRFFNRIQRVRIRDLLTPAKPPTSNSMTYIRVFYVMFAPRKGWRFSIAKDGKPVWITSEGYEFDASQFPKKGEHRYIFEESPCKFMGVDLRGSSVVWLCELYLGFLRALFEDVKRIELHP